MTEKENDEILRMRTMTQNNPIAEAATAVVEMATLVSYNFMRPCVLMHPQLTYSMEAQRWTAKYGDCEGVGPNPEKAMEAFDKQWST